MHCPLLVDLLLVFGQHVLLDLTGNSGGLGVNVFGLQGLLVVDGSNTVLGKKIGEPLGARYKSRSSLGGVTYGAWLVWSYLDV